MQLHTQFINYPYFVKHQEACRPSVCLFLIQRLMGHLRWFNNSPVHNLIFPVYSLTVYFFEGMSGVL